jgi:hypothetical protein
MQTFIRHARIGNIFPSILLICFACVRSVFADSPNVITFPSENVKFVRVSILSSSTGSEPCLDELEVYGEDDQRNLALPENGGKASASSCIQGYEYHSIAHLNDGKYGNEKSWIAAGPGPEWAQMEFANATEVRKVVFSRDRNGGYSDRIPLSFEILTSMDGQIWKSVHKAILRLDGASGAGAIPGPTAPPVNAAKDEDLHSDMGRLRYAFLGEEHAWLKTYGRADLNPGLVPYNGRVKEYPRHVGDDVAPLSRLDAVPKLDGVMDDDCWRGASRGVVRVAFPYDFDLAPCVDYEAWAGVTDADLFLAIRADRLLSGHVAVISTPDSKDCGVLELVQGGLVYNTYMNGRVDKSEKLDAVVNGDDTIFEARIPLTLLPESGATGLRVGLGIGGRFTNKLGKPVTFIPAPFSLAEESPCVDRMFRVRISVPKLGAAVSLKGNAPGLEQGVTLAPGSSRVFSIEADRGPIGPEYNLKVFAGNEVNPYELHLFRYDPIERALALADEMLGYLSKKGVDVSTETSEFAAIKSRHEELLRVAKPDVHEERAAFFVARLAKRNLMMRDPDLVDMSQILFVKRNPFNPSHNYSDYFDAPFHPGGGVYIASIPRADNRFEPSDVALTQLFDASRGIARNPAASYNLDKVYFGYRPTDDGFYHVMAMNPDGTGLKQITNGPFHDFWPCPLPDGGLAFISTRCKSRVFCWRPQSSTLFRMTPDGNDIQPVSLANITEWAPSVMNDGRILWTRWEYVDKGADFGHTLWTIRPDGTHPELMFGNDIIQPNGYANGREIPGSREISCTLISHFGDLNGPIALLDVDEGRFNPKAIKCITPEVPWPGAPPREECFREAYPIAHDYFLCSHAPRDLFGIYVIDRFGNRELLYIDPAISSMCPTAFKSRVVPPTVEGTVALDQEQGEFILADVNRGLEGAVKPGEVKYLRIVQETPHRLAMGKDGEYPKDHEAFLSWYASPVEKVNGPFGWPSYVVKTPLGLVPVKEDGSAHFFAPAEEVLYFQALDKDFNEIQRMRSVVQLQPGEKRSCIGCHESRQMAPRNATRPLAKCAVDITQPSWGSGPFSYIDVVQPVLDAKCVKCHDANRKDGLDYSSVLDENKAPASYRTFIQKGLVHYMDCGWNSGGCELLQPLSFGSVKSKLWEVLNAGHKDVLLSDDETLRIKTWIDLNCPLWPDYIDRSKREVRPVSVAYNK